MRSMGSVEPERVFKGLLMARLKVEHAYYKMVDNLEAFILIWGVGGSYVQ